MTGADLGCVEIERIKVDTYFGFCFREETRILSSDIKLLKRKDFHG